MNDISTERRQLSPLDKFREQFDARRAELAGSLPAHIPFERYKRVIMNAVSRNPDLLEADRASLLISVAQAAADGLLCDGRDAALVIFNAKRKVDGRDQWYKAVQYMPMIAGILKKLRNSGELSTITARVVYAGDKFRNWIDDGGEHIEYEAGDEQDRDIVRCVFAMAKLKDGGIEVEVLKPADIEKIRNVSRSKDRGPWVDWWEQMAEKSAIRRLSKRLPISTDLDDLMRRDDALYDLNSRSDRALNAGRPQTSRQRLDALAGVSGGGNGRVIEHDAGTGEVLDLSREGEEESAASNATQTSEADREASSGDASQGAGSATSSQAGPAAETNGNGQGRNRAEKAAQADQQRGAAEQRSQGKTTVTSGRGGADEAKADPGKLSDEDQSLLDDLLRTARNAAAQGRDALDEFEDGLNAHEAQLMGPHMTGLKKAAREASANNGGAK